MLPFYVQLANDILLIKNIISNTPRYILDEMQEWLSIYQQNMFYVGLTTIQYSSMCSRYGLLQEKAGTVLWLADLSICF